MKKLSTLSVLMGVLFGMSVTSCTKEKEKEQPQPVKEKTTAEKLLGTWVGTHMADDENGNSVIDDNEKFLLEPGTGVKITFGANSQVALTNIDSTGGTIDSETTLSVWSLLNNDKQIRMVDSLNEDTTIINIDALTETGLILSVDEEQFKSWLILRR